MKLELPNKQENRTDWDHVAIRIQIIHAISEISDEVLMEKAKTSITSIHNLKRKVYDLGNETLSKLAKALDAWTEELVNLDLEDQDALETILGKEKSEEISTKIKEKAEEISAENLRRAEAAAWHEERDARIAAELEAQGQKEKKREKKLPTVARAIFVLNARFDNFNSGWRYTDINETFIDIATEHVTGGTTTSRPFTLEVADKLVNDFCERHKLDHNFFWSLSDKATYDEIQAEFIKKYPRLKLLHHELKHEALLDQARDILHGKDPAPNTEIIIQNADGTKLTIRGAVNETEALSDLRQQFRTELRELEDKLERMQNLLRLFSGAAEARPAQLNAALSALDLYKE